MNAIRMVLVMGVCLIASACQPAYDGVKMRVLTGKGDAGGGEIRIEQGRAMAIEVLPQSANPWEDYEDFNLIELRSFNENIALVAPADKRGRFVIAGAGLGRAAVDVVIDGRTVDSLRAEVVRQEVP